MVSVIKDIMNNRDLTKQVTIESTDEIGILSKSFNDLVSELNECNLKKNTDFSDYEIDSDDEEEVTNDQL